MKCCVVLLFLSMFPLNLVYSQVKDIELPPTALSSSRFSVPESVIEADIDGRITISVLVDKNGKASEPILVFGPIWPCGSDSTSEIKELAKSLGDSVSTLRYSAGQRNGKPIAKRTTLSMTIVNPKVEKLYVGLPKIDLGSLNGLDTLKYFPQPDRPYASDGGIIDVKVVIDPDGNVVRAGGMFGSENLQKVSRIAACNAKLKPILSEGRKAWATGSLRYFFVELNALPVRRP